MKEPEQEQGRGRRKERRKELPWKWKEWRIFGNMLEQLKTGKEDKNEGCLYHRWSAMQESLGDGEMRQVNVLKASQT